MFQLPEFDPCPFCENVAGRPVRSPFDGELVPCAVVEERAETLAFVNTRLPSSGLPGWALIIPKRHAQTLLDLSEAEATAIMAHARRIANAVAAAFAPDGLRMLQNNGVAADQTVPHYHLHILPCRQGDTTRPPAPNERGSRIPFPERLRIAEQIRTHLED